MTLPGPKTFFFFLFLMQVEETMKNPEFQKQMRSMMDNPAMKAQLAEVMM